jgi:photosystem II stability/assembly factor-like uncharacterized protein
MAGAIAALMWFLPPDGVPMAQQTPDTLLNPAIMSDLAARSVLTDVTTAGTRMVAVGERGIILLSDDNGATWRQVMVPVSVTLTAVQFVTPKTGWVTGHCGVVLKSEDGGITWNKQLDGKMVADIVLKSAQKQAVKTQAACIPGKEKELKEKLAYADRLLADGPDKPFLDLYFENETNGFIIGAYNLIFRTNDGGNTWAPWMEHVENQMELHLYDIQAIGDDLYIAGEQGLLLRSSDGGEAFKALPSPYDGTFFGCVSPGENRVLVFGLQGNAFLSIDRGMSWQKVDTGVSFSVSTGMKATDGRLILLTLDGQVLMNTNKECTSFKPLKKLFVPFSGIDESTNGSLILVGARGVMPFSLNAVQGNHAASMQ